MDGSCAVLLNGKEGALDYKLTSTMNSVTYYALKGDKKFKLK